MALSKHPANWRAVRQEFESTSLSIRSLALKFNVPKSTLLNRIRVEGWERSTGEQLTDLGGYGPPVQPDGPTDADPVTNHFLIRLPVARRCWLQPVQMLWRLASRTCHQHYLLKFRPMNATWCRAFLHELKRGLQPCVMKKSLPYERSNHETQHIHTTQPQKTASQAASCLYPAWSPCADTRAGCNDGRYGCDPAALS